MHCLLLPSLRRWVCALSASVRGRVSEFRKRSQQAAPPACEVASARNPRYAPILASVLRSLFALDCVAEPSSESLKTPH
jgi:hypothetical protein